MNIIELAKQAEFSDREIHIARDNFARFAALVAAQERDFIATKWENWYGYDKEGVAEFIRKRANTQGEQHEPT